jgi:preprotein translocase subunit SecA
MIGNLIKRIFGTKHERELRRVQPIVAKVNGFEPAMSKLDDAQLLAKTAEFKQRYANGETLDALMPEAFAVVRETSRRVLGMRHYDVQIIGGIALHEGKIAEMKTGEGKTLVATSAMYLNALAGEGTHLITVNDYLASRDADWMGQLYGALGLTTGKILTNLSNGERQRAYAADITYGTNNEFGFDYLRDHMKYRANECAQRGLFFAIVDEVDSILIDEARTPLIISGQVEQSLELYYEVDKIIPFLKKDQDYVVDEKHHSVSLTDEGLERIEKHLKIDNLYEPQHIEYLHHVNKALQAHTLYKKDVNYIIDQGKVVIVDEFTGRAMPGRRWSDGLHQAIEAKEGVEIQNESETLATITFQNYFRMYKKLAGMTGTADTEAEEFQKTYNLEVFSIPTNKPVVRQDHPDLIYRSEGDKIASIVDQIEQSHKAGQPILVGTVSVEKSEVISKVLRKKKVPHAVLNAKNHRAEAAIIAQAGSLGAVTIATNMAGRGTDILLGGNPEFLARQEVARLREQDPSITDEAAQRMEEDFYVKFRAQCASDHDQVVANGGLFVIGTERHESRRIDNQLRGRAGRQGDPGASRFYLSLDDDLMRIFGAERIGGMMDRLGMEAGVPIEHPLVTRAIENAQKRVEGRNFDMRKHLLEYDDVMNKQRHSVYDTRRKVLFNENLSELMLDMFEDVVIAVADKYCPPGVIAEDWDKEGFAKEINEIFNINVDLSPKQAGHRDGLLLHTWRQVEQQYRSQQGEFDKVAQQYNARFASANADMPKKSGAELLQNLEQRFYLKEIDTHWRAHLNAMSSLRESVSLRSYAQKDPKQEYKKGGYDMFVELLARIKTDVCRQVFRVEPQAESAAPAPSMGMRLPEGLGAMGGNPAALLDALKAAIQQQQQRISAAVTSGDPADADGAGQANGEADGGDDQGVEYVLSGPLTVSGGDVQSTMGNITFVSGDVATTGDAPKRDDSEPST